MFDTTVNEKNERMVNSKFRIIGTSVVVAEGSRMGWRRVCYNLGQGSANLYHKRPASKYFMDHSLCSAVVARK